MRLSFHGCTNALERPTQSALSSISRITSLQHTDAPEHPVFIRSQRRFPFLALRILSIQCRGEHSPIKAKAFDPTVPSTWLLEHHKVNIFGISYEYGSLPTPTTCLILPNRLLTTGSYPFCLQYLMRGRVLPIKVCASDSSALLLRPGILCGSRPFAFSISCERQCLPLTALHSILIHTVSWQ